MDHLNPRLVIHRHDGVDTFITTPAGNALASYGARKTVDGCVEFTMPEEAHYWGVYRHLEDGTAEYVGDCAKSDMAHLLALAVANTETSLIEAGVKVPSQRIILSTSQEPPVPSYLPDPLGCRACQHPDCDRYDGPRQVECRAMAQNACARAYGQLVARPAPETPLSLARAIRKEVVELDVAMEDRDGQPTADDYRHLYQVANHGLIALAKSLGDRTDFGDDEPGRGVFCNPFAAGALLHKVLIDLNDENLLDPDPTDLPGTALTKARARWTLEQLIPVKY